MEELTELVRMFERLENNFNELEWALQFQRVIGQLITVMQDSLIEQENSTTEFQELLTVTLNNLKENINRYVVTIMESEIERMNTAQGEN